MADQVVYVFEGTSTYITDIGLSIDWVGRYNVWPGLSHAQMAPIASAAGATPYTPELAPKLVKDVLEKIFDPRRLKFTMRDPAGNRATIEIIVRDRLNIIPTAEAVRGAIQAIGSYRVNRIDLVGERWRDIYDWLVLPTDKVTTMDAPRLNQRRRFSGRMEYDSDDGREKIDKFSMQTSVTPPAAPPHYTDAVAVGIDNTSSPRTNDNSPSEPRHYVVKSLWTDALDGAVRSQQSKMPVCENDEDFIISVGELLAAVPSVNSLLYQGENMKFIEKLLSAPIP
ncbi:hypothetical protein NG798_00590 [Ancylothrix sp. C2]|uniref:hypothetical protein n=1 Tax=Ancylothrix sp. D3o TaxID=2953691 RepID=UPI0021BAB5EE|nr:hypothetical protein [Ancylothrix sp. D3o]MCT7948290.1 hypothetical protein [Ancylothrix sp. D3o]